MKIGILFDMDGTLWDSSENVAASWNEVISRRKLNLKTLTKADIMSVMGHTMTEIADDLFASVSEELRYDLSDECMANENDYLSREGGTLYPGLIPTLKTLAGMLPLSIVSNCQSGYIETFLDYYDLWSLFTDHLCFGDNGLPKGDNIRLLAERNSYSRYFYVGDIQADHDAAVAGGAEFIHAAYGFGTVHEKVPTIRAFSELPDLIRKLL